MKFFNYFSKIIGVDLGTAKTAIYLKGKGIVINEPSIVAFNNKSNQVLAIGEGAKKMLNRAPAHISVIRPLTNGVISDFEMAQEMVRYFLKQASEEGSLFNYRRAVVGISSNLTEVEQKSVEDAVVEAGANKTHLIEEPIAAAIGADLPIESATANVIIDIGAGTTKIAIISLGGVVTSKSLKVGGDKFNEEIVNFIRDEFKLAIGEPTAEEIKIAIGSAIPLDEKRELAIRGRDMSTGLPREVVVKGYQIRTALSRSLRVIIESLKDVIETAPPELVGDILKQKINLCGGGSLLRGIDQLIAKELSVETQVAEDPLTCVMRGIGKVVERFPEYTHLLDTPKAPQQINL